MDAKRLQRRRTDLAAFPDAVLPDLGRKGRRAWAEFYLRGLLLEGRRRSVAPMAQRLRAIDRREHDDEPGLQQFVNPSPWDDRPVRDARARHLRQALGGDGYLMLEDTGFPKPGRHAVGVARPYSGTLGTVGNGQVAVTLQFATGQEVVGLDAAQYLPEAWGEDRPRLRPAAVPADVGDRPKW